LSGFLSKFLSVDFSLSLSAVLSLSLFFKVDRVALFSFVVFMGVLVTLFLDFDLSGVKFATDFFSALGVLGSSSKIK
jgi:hypothetical protein